MTRAYVLGLSPSQQLQLLASNPHAASFAYDRLAVCRAAAEIQMRRLWDAAARAKAQLSEPRTGAPASEFTAFVQRAKKLYEPLLFETHFYFVAWANCGNMLRVLTGQPEFLTAKKVFDSYRKHFKHYTAARNSFEHYHDRLPGNVNEERVRALTQEAEGVRVYFGFDGGDYRHSDMSWDITPNSLTLLTRSVDDTLAVLHRALSEIVNAKFPET